MNATLPLARECVSALIQNNLNGLALFGQHWADHSPDSV